MIGARNHYEKESSRRGGLLAGMRIRKKLLFLHTCFSLGLAGILVIALRPAITRVIEQAELHAAQLALSQVLSGTSPPSDDDLILQSGSAADLGLEARTIERARAVPDQPVVIRSGLRRPTVVMYEQDRAVFHTAVARIPGARTAVTRVYVLMIVALLAVYGLVAAALELFVLPQHVYDPIRRLLRADQAVQEGEQGAEIIPESAMPADELGEIMRSRNASIVAMRRNEADLADALSRLENVANDLKRKNHLLESARRNLMDADRLASLGMMSAGIAHELNTPLAVVRGLVEQLNEEPRGTIAAEQAALMRRVVGRLERLGESLLDFARVRAPQTSPVAIRTLVDEAITLVRLDRESGRSRFENRVSPDLIVECDGDRIVQVLVNLLRNASDAVRDAQTPPAGSTDASVEIEASTSERDGERWASITVADSGPGIDPELLTTLFEPFVSTRLDARGTGLGLAVAEGIVKEHGGVLLVRNRAEQAGAIFEIMLPSEAARYPDRPAHEAATGLSSEDTNARADA